MTDNLARALRLLAVTDDAFFDRTDPMTMLAAAVRGGVTAVQIRLARATPRELAELVRRACRELPVPVFVNDRVDVALAAGAAGVHLGADDLPIARVRAVAPPGFLIGGSVGTPAEAEAGREADYWGIGPWRVTTTKADAGAALGAPGFAALVGLARGRPCVAIGGVQPDDVPAVLGGGGVGVAVVSGLFAAPDVERRAMAYRARLDAGAGR